MAPLYLQILYVYCRSLGNKTSARPSNAAAQIQVKSKYTGAAKGAAFAAA